MLPEKVGVSLATGRKKSTAATPAAKKKSTPRARQAAVSPPASDVRREVWAILHAALAVISLLSLFPFDGFLLKGLRQLTGALIGFGMYILPLSFAGLCALLLVQNKGPVRLRGSCIMLLPVLSSALMQGIAAPDQYGFAMQTFSLLFTSGIAGNSGGLFGGWLYILLEWAFSSVGAFLILILLCLSFLFVIFRLTPAAVWEMLKTPTYEYEDEEERQKYEAPVTLPNLHTVAAERRARKQSKRQIDIPVDDTPIGTPLPKQVISPAEYLETLPHTPASTDATASAESAETAAQSDAFGDILSIIQQPKAAASPLSETEASNTVSNPISQEEPIATEKRTKAEQKAQAEAEDAALAAAITANQQTPLPAYDYPPLSLLQESQQPHAQNNTAELTENSQRLLDTLDSFGIDAKIIHIVRGPSVTRFELTIERGVKFSRITALSDDIALSLGAISVRIAPIPDKMAIGIEVPNKTTATVFIRDVIGSRSFQAAKGRLSFAVGKDITGSAVIGDISKMPHMLIAGTTGAGKSVCINSMLISLLYKSTPEEVRLIMVDPKMVELGNYNGIPHLLIPVVTDPKKASSALNWAVGEMERRYKVFAEQQVRDLAGYNVVMHNKKAEALQMEGGTPDAFHVLPQIVIVIDELADLMMVAAKEVETSICRIAQKARAAGMHLIVATQRPSADVITGIMKANIPSRISFAVASQIESRIILDQNGAEKLIGKGDMLYAPLGGGKPTRVQGCFISSDEIEAVIAKVKEGATADYSEEILEHIERQAESDAAGGAGADSASEEDELLLPAIEVVVDAKQASVSLLQRRLKLGYSRAARIIDQMEERGIVGPFEGSKPRQLLISYEEWQEMKMRRDIR